VHIMRGDMEAAVRVLERGLAISQEHDLVHGICANGIYLAWAALLTGNQARGLECLTRGLERTPGALMQWTRYGTVSAAAYLAAGRPDEARRVIAHGLAEVAARDARGYRAPLLRLEAEVLVAEGEEAVARQRVEEALAVAVEIGVPPEIGHCRAALGRIAARLGDKATAAQQLAAAQRIFEELGMAFWADRVGN
jgi:tetratricopeptide (TPR) repeat protein